MHDEKLVCTKNTRDAFRDELVRCLGRKLGCNGPNKECLGAVVGWIPLRYGGIGGDLHGTRTPDLHEEQLVTREGQLGK